MNKDIIRAIGQLNLILDEHRDRLSEDDAKRINKTIRTLKDLLK